MAIYLPTQITPVRGNDVASLNQMVGQLNNVLADIYRKMGLAAPAQPQQTTLQSNEVIMPASVNLSLANGQYQDLGFSIKIPSGGTYSLYANVRVDIAYSAGGAGAMIGARLYNASCSAYINNSERAVSFALLNTDYQAVLALHTTITVKQSSVINLYAKRDNATTWTTSTIVSDGDGRTNMGYVKIA